MATYDNVYTPGFAGRIGQTLVNAVSAFSAWNAPRVTRNTLHQLTDRELEDIGLSRGDIDTLI